MMHRIYFVATFLGSLDYLFVFSHASKHCFIPIRIRCLWNKFSMVNAIGKNAIEINQFG